MARIEAEVVTKTRTPIFQNIEKREDALPPFVVNVDLGQVAPRLELPGLTFHFVNYHGIVGLVFSDPSIKARHERSVSGTNALSFKDGKGNKIPQKRTKLLTDHDEKIKVINKKTKQIVTLTYKKDDDGNLPALVRSPRPSPRLSRSIALREPHK